MKVAVTGSHGFIGSAVVAGLTSQGHVVTRVSRTSTGFHTNDLGGAEAVIHLAGEPIAQRWTPKTVAAIRESRVAGTQHLCEALASLSTPPKVLMAASAIGYYGNRGDEILEEYSSQGFGFLAGLCREWEAAAEPVRRRGIRIVHLRFGIVLSPSGGALKMMLPPFRLGLGGRLGSGDQYMSWIALDDIVGAVTHVLHTDTLQGPVNAVSPNPVRNQEFTKTLGRVLSRPTIFPVPAAILRLGFGRLADEMLLASARVRPLRLVKSGYIFRYPELETTLRHQLEQPRKPA